MSNWYLENGKEADVVVSSRIRFARNLQGLPFKSKMTEEEQEKLLEKVKYITPSLGYGLKFFYLKDMDDITKLSLVEKHIITPEMGMAKDNKMAILINDEENICILINEQDHVKIQVFQSGLDLQNTLNLAIELDEKLDEILTFACSKKYGYLTSRPIDTGTGLKASIIVHLPALKMTGNISKILRIVNNFSMSIHGQYGEDSQNKGDLYEISNNQTLGITEKQIAVNVENISKKIMEQERLARKYLAKEQLELEDKVYRSFGILTNATKLTYDESIDLLSDVKLGTDLGIIKELNDFKVKKMMIYTKPANIQKYTGKVLNGYDRDIKRAEIVKQIVKEQ